MFSFFSRSMNPVPNQPVPGGAQPQLPTSCNITTRNALFSTVGSLSGYVAKFMAFPQSSKFYGDGILGMLGTFGYGTSVYVTLKKNIENRQNYNNQTLFYLDTVADVLGLTIAAGVPIALPLTLLNSVLLGTAAGIASNAAVRLCKYFVGTQNANQNDAQDEEDPAPIAVHMPPMQQPFLANERPQFRAQ